MDRQLEEIKTRSADLVTKWVGAHVNRRPNLQPLYDDLVGEAMVKMLEIVEKCGPDPLAQFEGNFDQFAQYLRLSIHTGIVDFIRQNSLIPVRSKTPPVFENCNPKQFVDHTPVEPDETLETLRACVRDERDRQILESRLNDGGTFEETSARTGYSRNTIRVHLRRMRKRYEKMTS